LSETEFFAGLGDKDKTKEMTFVDLLNFLLGISPKWLSVQKATPNNPAIVLSQKMSFSRNIKKYPFLENTTIPEESEIYRDVSNAIKKTKIFPSGKLVEIKLCDSNAIINAMLFEKDFIPANIAAAPDKIKGIFMNGGDREFPVVLANIQNHLTISLYCNIGKEEQAFEKINKIDNILGEELIYAYDSQLGFLFSKPEECGCGFSFETVFHLPGLVMTEEIMETLNGISVMGAKIDEIFGNLTDNLGAFFKVVTGNYLGGGEKEIIEKTKEICGILTAAELKARKRLFKDAKKVMEDKIYRSFGMLKFAKIMPFPQFLNFISLLRLGSEYKVIPFSLEFLNKILEKGFFTNIILLFDEQLKSSDFNYDEERANLLRNLLKDCDLN
jgi:protein arginine kinase